MTLTIPENKPVTPRDIETLTDQFIASQDIRATSRDTYRKGLKQFLNWIATEGTRAPTRETILAYKDHLAGSGLSSLTIAGYMVTVRKFFDWTESNRYYPNIAKGIRGTKRAKGFKKDAFTISQVKDLLSSIDRTTGEGKRDYALLNLMVRTGLRTIEIIRINIEDIRQEGGEALLYIQGKGRDSKDEFVLLTPDTLRPIHEYLLSRGKYQDNDPLFTSLSDRNHNQRLTTRTIRRLVKEHLEDIGIRSNRLTAHSLRHTAITLSLIGGATIQEAQALGRHTNINTTLIYAHNINRIQQAPERKIDALLN